MSDSYTAGLVALLSANVAGSPYAVPPVPENATFPYTTIREISSIDLESLSGPSGLARSVIQVECWSPLFDAAWNHRKLIKTFLLPYKGAAGTLVIAAVNHAGDRQIYDGNRELHQILSSFLIWWET